MRNLFPLATLQAVVVIAVNVLAGCQSSSESVRQARVESISTAKGADVAYLASRSGAAGAGAGASTELIKTAAVGTSSLGEVTSLGEVSRPAAPQTALTSSGNSAWSRLFGGSKSSDRVALPPDNRRAPGDSAEKGPADDF